MRLGFVQADPIRAPARAQDLTLRHRVKGYTAGDLERRYEKLAIDEDYFVNYGFLPRAHLALMHPRRPQRVWTAVQQRRATDVLAHVCEQGVARPKDVQAVFDHGRTRNAWGGSFAVPCSSVAMRARGSPSSSIECSSSTSSPCRETRHSKVFSASKPRAVNSGGKLPPWPWNIFR